MGTEKRACIDWSGHRAEWSATRNLPAEPPRRSFRVKASWLEAELVATLPAAVSQAPVAQVAGQAAVWTGVYLACSTAALCLAASQELLAQAWALACPPSQTRNCPPLRRGSGARPRPSRKSLKCL